MVEYDRDNLLTMKFGRYDCRDRLQAHHKFPSRALRQVDIVHVSAVFNIPGLKSI